MEQEKPNKNYQNFLEGIKLFLPISAGYIPLGV